MLRIVAASVLIGLGTAGPAVASERHKPPPPTAPEPVAPLPAVPEPELPPLPIPDPPGPVTDPLPIPLPEPVFDPVFDPGAAPEPDFEPPSPEASTPEAETQPGASESDEQPATPDVTTTTQSDGGNVNVSVRVDSPGIEAPVVQEAPEPPVISLPAQPDITPAAGIVPPAPATPETVTPPTPIQSDATNTNVAVRVLSPGDNDPVTQTNAVPAPAAAPSSRESSSPSDTAENTSGPLADSDQYQTPNSQYQSSDDPGWIWNWTLTHVRWDRVVYFGRVGRPDLTRLDVELDLELDLWKRTCNPRFILQLLNSRTPTKIAGPASRSPGPRTSTSRSGS